MDQNTLYKEKEEILAYVHKYGRTRLGDLVNYGMHKLNLSLEKSKILLEELVLYGYLEQVIHEELSQPVTYLKEAQVAFLERDLKYGSSGGYSRGQMDATHEIICQAVEDAQKRLEKDPEWEKKFELTLILDQAKALAEKRNNRVRGKAQSRKESNLSPEKRKNNGMSIFE